MSVNAMSLKARIRNYAKQKSIPAQVVLQNYMFECLLVRLSASNYKENFILKRRDAGCCDCWVGPSGYHGFRHNAEKSSAYAAKYPGCT